MKGGYAELRDGIGQRESSSNYQAVNRSNYLGKYQFGELALIDLGYVRPDATRKENDYVGGWTGKDGINSKADFLNSPAVQDSAAEKYHSMLWRQIRQFGLDKAIGQTIGGVDITASGLIAGAHLVGIRDLKDFIKSNGANEHRDGMGTDIREYIKKFADYDVSSISHIPNSIVPVISPAIQVTQTKPLDPATSGWTKAKSISSPLILDLDGNGIATTSQGSGTYFDHDGDGIWQSTGWVGSSDGLLVLDRDGNGEIQSGSELFGDHSLISDGRLARNGFEALRNFDSNHDGRIDSQDEVFTKLQVWIDSDGDGLSLPSELYGLKELGLASISLDYQEGTQIDGSGNDHRQRGSFLMQDGTSGDIHDVWFAQNLSDAVAPLASNGASTGVPDLPGSGSVADLRTVAANDKSGAVEALVHQFGETKDESARLDLAADILAHWAGKDSVSAQGRGSYVNAQHLAVLEAFAGEAFYQPGWGKNPGRTAGRALEETFEALVHKMAAQIDAQTRFLPFYEKMGVIQADGTATALDMSPIFDDIKEQLLTDPQTAGSNLDLFLRDAITLGLLDQTQLDKMDAALVGLDADVSGSIQLARMNLLQGRGTDDALSGTDGNDRIIAFGGNDTLRGQASDDLLLGGAGNDSLEGGPGQDTLNGGPGDDVLNGGAGSDVYVFRKGFGHDRIEQNDSAASSHDVADFQDYSSSEAVLLRIDTDLVIRFAAGDSLTVARYFEAAARRLDLIQFSDGAAWEINFVKAHVVGVNSDLTGSEFVLVS